MEAEPIDPNRPERFKTNMPPRLESVRAGWAQTARTESECAGSMMAKHASAPPPPRRAAAAAAGSHTRMVRSAEAEHSSQPSDAKDTPITCPPAAIREAVRVTGRWPRLAPGPSCSGTGGGGGL